MRRETVKERNRKRLIEYLSDPENEPLPRRRLSTEVLQYKHENAIYLSLTPDELMEIEHEALGERRKRYAIHLATADLALCRKAADGDVSAIRLMYEKFEGWRGNAGADGGAAEKTTVIVIRTSIPDAQPAVDMIELDQVWGADT